MGLTAPVNQTGKLLLQIWMDLEQLSLDQKYNQ